MESTRIPTATAPHGDRDVADGDDQRADLLQSVGFDSCAPGEHRGRHTTEPQAPQRGGDEQSGARTAADEHREHPGPHQSREQIERFHQTLKRWLTARPRATTLPQLQAQLDAFRDHYNHHRPHRAAGGKTPAAAYAASPKALPATPREGHFRLRYDPVGTNGKMILRRAAHMHHLGIGYQHRSKRILALSDDTTVTVIHLDTGEILSEHHIDPTRSYRRNQLTPPGRWPQK